MKVIDGTIASPLGFSADGLHAGFKKRKMDFGWIVSEKPASVAGVYTTNKVIAAPLIVTKTSVKKAGKMKAIVVNSGVANSCTGTQGLEDAYTMQEWTAEKLGVEPDLVGVASTGVIGELLPMDTLKNGLSKLVVNGNADDFAKAILTTDTATKTIAVTETFGRDVVTMAGVAKGSGMIHPNMATMLAFITTDADISAEMLKRSLLEVVKDSFNMLSVDGDTSTNDTVAVLASGLCGNEKITSENADYKAFTCALAAICEKLVKLMAKDGEGATKLVECIVSGAADQKTAKICAKSVICSSLVKAAMFGADANWGRILCALGYSGADIDVHKVDVKFSSAGGEIEVCKDGSGIPFSEELAKKVLVCDEVYILVDLKSGSFSAAAYGCDLTYDYVKINGDYRT